MSSPFGTALATYRFARNHLINVRLAVPSVMAAIIGSFIGSHVSLMVPEKVMAYVLVAVLPLSAFLVLNKKLFNDKGSNEVTLNKRTYLTASIAAFVIGCYDGFYGPGTGTFLIIAFTVFARLSIKTAQRAGKGDQPHDDITSLLIFLLNGQVIISLGLAARGLQHAGRLYRSRPGHEKRRPDRQAQHSVRAGSFRLQSGWILLG